MDMITVSAKTVDEAVTKALIELETTSDKLEYEVVEKGSSGFLGIGAKPAVIRAKKKERIEDRAIDFLNQVFQSMNMEVSITAEYNPEEREMNINMEGSDMGILIGKRGQTLDSLQYLVSLVVNKKKEEYIRVKLDTENYRERRKETLETLAKNIAYKVKRTKHSVSLEPMNPYERRIIHAALQNDKYVVTRSDGEEPFRHVIISLKRDGKKKRRTDSSKDSLQYPKTAIQAGSRLPACADLKKRTVLNLYYAVLQGKGFRARDHFPYKTETKTGDRRTGGEESYDSYAE